MSSELSTQLKKSLCDSWMIREDSPSEWTVSTPFLFEDGDGLPVFVRLQDNGWSIRDYGMTCSHLFFDDFNATESRMARILQLIEKAGAKLDATNEIAMQLLGPPDAYQIADFLTLLNQVQGIALTSQIERDQTRYITQVRQTIESHLVLPDFDENWTPPQLVEQTKAKYRADLRVGTTSNNSIVLFLASTSDKANVSSLSIHRFKQLGLPLLPVLAYHPEKVASEAVYRFQDEVQDDTAAVPVHPGDYSTLFKEFRNRGAELSNA
jgi:Domain of unknown function DUF1828